MVITEMEDLLVFFNVVASYSKVEFEVVGNLKI